ncbi:NnrU family protein [Candidatus Binatus sp.]|uniref:NnrU family protein n=1 Tax=Candidatus Binatus sp. TaxID=2811406 RepID=UPI003C3884A7
MDATVWIALWAVLFLASHLIISSSAVRSRLIGAVGEQPYRGIYSLIAFATLGPLIYEFARNKHAGPLLWALRAVAPIRGLAWLLMLTALILLVGSFITPNPGVIGAPKGGSEPRGLLKITRHPGLVGFSLFGIAHLLMNGRAGDVIFFGLFPALGIIGGMHQDRRKIRELGDLYREFVAKTSFVPFAALIGGRVRWAGNDMPWAVIGVGVVLTVAIVALHPMIFGGHPLG